MAINTIEYVIDVELSLNQRSNVCLDTSKLEAQEKCYS